MGDNTTNLTIPNLLTFFRILLTPGFVIAFASEDFSLAWILFAVAGCTDGLDGFLARALNQRSRLGIVLDPLADKILLVTSFVTLGVKGWLPVWLAVLVVSRDLMIVGGLVLLAYLGVQAPGRIRPSWVSKINTLAQISLVFLILFHQSRLSELARWIDALVALVALLTVVSGVMYVRRGFKWLGEYGGEGEV